MNKEIERIEILKFLQWNDSNGMYIDDMCRLEGIDPITYKEAVAYFYYYVFENIFNLAGYPNPCELAYEDCKRIAKGKNIFFKGEALISELVNKGDRVYNKIIDLI